MCNFHQVVINHIGQMIRGESIRLHQDEIFLHILLLESPINGIVKLRPAKLVTLKANYVRLSSLCPSVRLRGIYGAACPRVNSRLAGLVEFAFLRLQLLGCAEATVGVVMIQECLDVFLINRQPLRLHTVSWNRASDSHVNLLACMDHMVHHSLVLHPTITLPI